MENKIGVFLDIRQLPCKEGVTPLIAYGAENLPLDELFSELTAVIKRLRKKNKILKK